MNVNVRFLRQVLVYIFGLGFIIFNKTNRVIMTLLISFMH
jgi:hypothetical protein